MGIGNKWRLRNLVVEKGRIVSYLLLLSQISLSGREGVRCWRSGGGGHTVLTRLGREWMELEKCRQHKSSLELNCFDF